ncbi:MAG: hypothetical protein AB7C97_11785 [Oscillospiraceae bacterium]
MLILGTRKKARFADHLGERTVRIRKVESSILFVSTKKVSKLKDLLAFFISGTAQNRKRLR